MDPVSISAILTSLKTVSEVLKDWRKGGDDVTVGMDKLSDLTSAVLDAQDHAMEARQAQYDLMRRNDELERELRAYRDWRDEKETYEIVNVGERGAYVYARKSDAMPSVTPHWLCQPCFDDSRKSVLQYLNLMAHQAGHERVALWGCPVCAARVRALASVSPDS